MGSAHSRHYIHSPVLVLQMLLSHAVFTCLLLMTSLASAGKWHALDLKHMKLEENKQGQADEHRALHNVPHEMQLQGDTDEDAEEEWQEFLESEEEKILSTVTQMTTDVTQALDAKDEGEVPTTGDANGTSTESYSTTTSMTTSEGYTSPQTVEVTTEDWWEKLEEEEEEEEEEEQLEEFLKLLNENSTSGNIVTSYKMQSHPKWLILYD